MAASALESVIKAAVAATGATAGWVVAHTRGDLQVLAYCGPEEPARFLGATFPLAAAGTAGLAAGSGQPMAVRPRADDARMAQGPMSLLISPPTSYVTVPCADEDGVAGVIEVVDKRGGSFDIDDVELLSLLGDITASVLREHVGRHESDSSPLEKLAQTAPRVHAAVMSLIAALDSA